MMKVVKIYKAAGSFAENKDVARELRTKDIMPALKDVNNEVVLDFERVTAATQSFIHALISEAIRAYGDDVFDRLLFKNCTDSVQQVVNIVADYMEEQ
jgi:hypothetical protein